MTTLKKSRGLQYALHSEFTFNVGADGMIDIAGALTAFKAAGGKAWDVAGLPPNAVLVAGDVTVEAVSNDTGTATIQVGDSGSAARYLGATSIKAAARTALVPTGYRGVGEDLRITLTNANGDATAGKVTVRASHIVTGRANEVQAT